MEGQHADLAEDYKYDPFGNQLGAEAQYYNNSAMQALHRAEADGTDNPFRYCGEYQDAETGLVYLRGRYYDPSMERFITEDPIKAGQNWYAYCRNNPINRIDPSGFQQEYLLSIYSAPDNRHSFVVIDNLSKSDIKVGAYTLKAGESVTVGTWGDLEGNNGVFYNMEAYTQTKEWDYSKYVSLSMTISQDDLKLINEYISENDEWSITDNCSGFAAGLWNSVSKIQLKSGTPSILAKSIKEQKYYQIGRAFKSSTKAGYVNKDGKYVESSKFDFSAAGMIKNSSKNSAITDISTKKKDEPKKQYPKKKK